MSCPGTRAVILRLALWTSLPLSPDCCRSCEEGGWVNMEHQHWHQAACSNQSSSVTRVKGFGNLGSRV